MSLKAITKPEMWLLVALWCSILILLGVTLNHVVIKSNEGRMPVHYGYYGVIDKEYIAFQHPKQVEYPYLGDVIGWEINNYLFKVSIGDIIMVVFFLLLLLSLFLYRREKYKYIKPFKRKIKRGKNDPNI